MGNAISPIHIKTKEAFVKFLRTCKEDLMRNKGNSKENFRTFSVFLEDFIHNDEDYLDVDVKKKKLYIGTLVYLFKASPFVSPDTDFANPGFTIVDGFCKGASGTHIIQKVFKSKYVRDGSDFYEWDDKSKSLTECSKTSLNCNEFIEHVYRNVDVTSLDFSDELVTEAISDLNEFLEEIHTAVEALTIDSDKEIYLVKVKSKKFQPGPNIIPCHTGPFDISKGQMCKFYDKDTYVPEKLPFDPDQETTPLVIDFVKQFKCSNKILANHFMRCGVEIEPTLTVIYGPEGSGKRTLVQVTKSLYNSVEALKARTCYVDETYLLDVSKSDEHPCCHLVVVCENNDICDKSGKTTFGNRILQTVHLKAPIDPDNRVDNISDEINVCHQLGCLLGWAYQNCITFKLGMKSYPKFSEAMRSMESFGLLGTLLSKLDSDLEELLQKNDDPHVCSSSSSSSDD